MTYQINDDNLKRNKSTLNEGDIEYGFIKNLTDLKYTYRSDITTIDTLTANFRAHFERLNQVKLTQKEFEQLMREIKTPDVFAASERLRRQNTYIREDGTPLHYSLVNMKDWCKNEFEVINQLSVKNRTSRHRYDVIILLNGVPMVQIELKTLDVTPRKAIEQIMNYKRDEGTMYTDGLLCFLQLFIVSNKTETYYFTNNNPEHFQFNADEQYLPVYRWADTDNNKITQLDNFASEFLAKCTLAKMISRYMVLVQTEKKLLMMRPYQIYAAEAIIKSVEENRGNGYIWHTTGSGKTLTSFKAATLMKENDHVYKCLFVVDRKDLDKQTREEFNKFQEGCVEENTSTKMLVERMLSTDYKDKVIVTTIQKLGRALEPTANKPLRQQLKALSDKRIVFIFDECHRSQFGENHQAIKEFFPNAQLFGFTGTPIFPDNASGIVARSETERTHAITEDIFPNRLHTYTIAHAIDDHNVLQFLVEYYKAETDKEGNLKNPNDHRNGIIKKIIETHDANTYQRVFNAILATQSIDDATRYYYDFKQVQKDKLAADPNYQPLNIAMVYSPPPGVGGPASAGIEEDLDNEKADYKTSPDRKKAALEQAISDYNTQYGTSFAITDFDKYYQDVQGRIKDHRFSLKDFRVDKRIDITIVVDMMLTGFDSKHLSTLYVDKRLKYHGLVQAFSRTNRTLNATKPFGKILDFLSQKSQVDEAITLFSNVTQGKERQIWLVPDQKEALEKLVEAQEKYEAIFDKHGLPATPDQMINVPGDSAKIELIEATKDLVRARNAYDLYTKDPEELGPEYQQMHQSIYETDAMRSIKASCRELANQIINDHKDKDDAESQAIQQMDFEFVLFESNRIDLDYILALAAKIGEQEPDKIAMSKVKLMDYLRTSSNLQTNEPSLTAFIETLEFEKGYSFDQIKDDYLDFRERIRTQSIATIAANYQLDVNALTSYLEELTDSKVYKIEYIDALLKPRNLGFQEKRSVRLGLLADLRPVISLMTGGATIQNYPIT